MFKINSHYLLFHIMRKIHIILVTVLSLTLGYYLGYNGVFYSISKINNFSTTNNATSSISVKVEGSNLFDEVKSNLNNKFVSWRKTYTPPTDKEIEDAIIKGYVDAYDDPYTQYFPPVEAKQFLENVSGSFGGVGMEVNSKDGVISVIAPLKDSPAMKVGIKTGDIIYKVDGVDVTGKSVEDVVSKIRGEIGTVVKVEVVRNGVKDPLTFEIKRDTISIPTIDSKLQDGVYIINLYNFSANSAELFRQELIKFSQAGTDKLVIDLRGNPGGYLEAAVNIASFFLNEGDVVVKEIGNDEYNKSGDKVHKAKGFKAFGEGLKLYVIVDGGSASASEILAGALQDHKAAKILGLKSYGKGSVQELVTLSNGGSLKVTVANWFTPNGRSITEDKIVPDVELKRDEKTTLESETKHIVDIVLKDK